MLSGKKINKLEKNKKKKTNPHPPPPPPPPKKKQQKKKKKKKKTCYIRWLVKDTLDLLNELCVQTISFRRQ